MTEERRDPTLDQLETLEADLNRLRDLVSDDGDLSVIPAMFEIIIDTAGLLDLVRNDTATKSERAIVTSGYRVGDHIIAAISEIDRFLRLARAYLAESDKIGAASRVEQREDA